ncbi:hypothetical protein EHQ53_07635 [Leptospira langatensis]|uniref:Uncharacterized protein n=1 Tax=Leptospira langatensis TaxID=2484983 RepID=A0A5F1ZUD0_9LEPT|nr:hypothetical protein [Leptospira langatensis]TGK01487.1 hypothetical protein EHO57_11235 [Leptospira langatensis]TGL42063.1 hypothetical protein EHQ53_07635 [Leptospira langatensis]
MIGIILNKVNYWILCLLLLFAFGCEEKPKVWNPPPDREKLSRDILGPEFNFIFRITKGEVTYFEREADIFSEWGTFSISLKNQRNSKKIDSIFKKAAVANGWKYDKEGCNQNIYSTVADRPGCMQFRYRFKEDPQSEFLLHVIRENENLKIFYRLDGN